MSDQALQHLMQMDHMQSEVAEFKEMIQQITWNHETSQHINPYPKTPPISNPVLDEHNQNLKLEPIKWPEAYDHKDQTEWSTTHGVLQYIYRRGVEQRKFLELSDFFMNLFSHAVTGTAKDMIKGKFQEMMANWQSDDALGLLKAVDETHRYRNEEQIAASLFFACKQFKDESLSSFLPRLQQLLVKSPSSSQEDKNRIYDLRNALNQTTRNYLIGRPRTGTFSEFLDLLYTVGFEIEEVCLVKTKIYRLNQVGIFDDNTGGVAGGKLLGSATSANAYRGPPNSALQISGNKETDGDIIMIGVN